MDNRIKKIVEYYPEVFEFDISCVRDSDEKLYIKLKDGMEIFDKNAVFCISALVCYTDYLDSTQHIDICESSDSLYFSLYVGDDPNEVNGSLEFYKDGLDIPDILFVKLYEYKIEVPNRNGYLPDNFNLESIYTRYNRVKTINNIIQ